MVNPTRRAPIDKEFRLQKRLTYKLWKSERPIVFPPPYPSGSTEGGVVMLERVATFGFQQRTVPPIRCLSANCTAPVRWRRVEIASFVKERVLPLLSSRWGKHGRVPSMQSVTERHCFSLSPTGCFCWSCLKIYVTRMLHSMTLNSIFLLMAL
ncbi:hypothetical protein CDAR_94821 [Caerostris darwini]|uniref:Uncharacterized protein n=1 Tax=Caerostris darwini TaxID=1538125 RepID=A0AAV4PKP8_9ARAC|nr:hypothetical protein CDAR_94821 [Caerostris darwini]